MAVTALFPLDGDIHSQENLLRTNKTPSPTPLVSSSPTRRKSGITRHISDGSKEKDIESRLTNLKEKFSRKIDTLLEGIPCGSREAGRVSEAARLINRFVFLDISPFNGLSKEALQGKWKKIAKKELRSDTLPYSIYYRVSSEMNDLEVVITKLENLGSGITKKISETLEVTKTGARIFATIRPAQKKQVTPPLTPPKGCSPQPAKRKNSNSIPTNMARLNIFDFIPLDPFACAMKKEMAVLEELHQARVPFIPTILHKEVGAKKCYTMESATSSLDAYITKGFIDRNPNTETVYNTIRPQIIIQLTSMLHKMHETCGRAHLDLKPANVLITVNGTSFKICVIDFGASEKNGTVLQQIVGTPGWFAPEILSPQYKATTETDVWNLGLLLLYLKTKINPFLEIQDFPSKGRWTGGFVRELRQQIDLLFRGDDEDQLIALMLDQNPSQRPHISEVLNAFQAIYPQAWQSYAKENEVT